MLSHIPTDFSVSLYDRLGGEKPLRKFVDRLYHYMASLPEVRQVHALHAMPLDEAAVRLFRFLSGWLGGPPLYHSHYGEPRLRRRHLHIPIGNNERDQWLLCAQRSLEEMNWSEELKQELMQLLTDMADHLKNRNENIRDCETACITHHNRGSV